jgi:hypothetical protein
MNASRRLWLVVLLISYGRLTSTSHAQTYDWSTATTISPGVKWAAFTPNSPRLLNINVLQVDTSTPRLRFTTTGRRSDWVSNVTETDKATTRLFISRSQNTDRPIMAAINASPWSPFPADDNVPANLQGLAVSDGVLVSPGRNNSPAFIIDNLGIPRIQLAGPTFDISNVNLAVAGFGIVLTNGIPIPSTGSLEPRSGFGISADSRYIYLMTIDGRRYSSQGATIGEVGQYLAFFGASSGINMDGGGSTTLARWNSSTQSADLLNVPNAINLIDPTDPVNSQSVEAAAFQYGLLPNERFVGNNLGIYYQAVPEASSIILIAAASVFLIIRQLVRSKTT